MRPILKALTAVLLVSLGATGAAGAARDGSEFVVIAAAGNSPVGAGTILAPGQEVAIEAGTTVLVLARSGSVLRLTGPCRCRLPGDAPEPGAKRKTLTRGFTLKPDLWNVALPTLRSMAEPSTGGDSRAPQAVVQPDQPDQPDLWAMAVDSSGNRCVRRGEAHLWRRSATVAAIVDLRSSRSRQTGLTWPAGQRLMRLPGDFLEDGGPLVLSIDSQPRRLVVHVLPATIDESEWGEILIWMAARDCRRQAQFLVDGLNNGTLFPDHDRRPGLSEL